MDIQTSHLLSKLDRLIDNQRDQGELLHQILEGPPASTKPGPDDLSGSKVTAITAPITRGAMMWILGAAIISYLVRGGDPIALIEVLLKSFG
jgi:hypothetical protein